jgi:hypothetical protein
MRTLAARAAAAAAVVAPLSFFLVQCGSDAPHAGADAAAQDAPSTDGTLHDAFVPDAGSSNGDADATVADAEPDGGVADAADAGAAFDAMPCIAYTIDAASDVEAGEAGAPDDAGGDGETLEAAEAGPTPPTSSCPGALSCCGGFCTDTSKDPRNCGSCGNACGPAQFCTGTACDDAVLNNLCGNPRATLVLDPYAGDNDAGQQLASAMALGCMPMTSIRLIDQEAGIAEDPATGRPLTGPGDTLVAGGGLFGQRGVAYMEAKGLTPLAVGSSGADIQIRSTKTNAVLVSVPYAMVTARHDYVVLEVSVEPVSGTLCFFGFGLGLPGTAAAAYYYRNNVVPNRAMYPAAWYLYEWTDTDNSGTASAGDTFALIANGM